MTRILIVAAYASVRAGLHALLEGADDCTVVAEVADSAELACFLPEARPDVVLLDYFPGDGARVLRALEGGEAGLVLLGEEPRGHQRLAGSSLPGWGYLRKEAGRDEIVGAARAVAAGLIVLDRGLALAAPFAAEEDAVAAPLWEALRPDIPLAPGEALTPRERDVLQLMARGLPNKQIATHLSISPHTVKFHVASLLAKLGAASRTEAVALGARRGDVLL